jgi:hypothetical protein
MGMGIAGGVIAGFLMRTVYVFTPSEFFRDDVYFEGVLTEEEAQGFKITMNDTMEMKEKNMSVNPSQVHLESSPGP